MPLGQGHPEAVQNQQRRNVQLQQGYREEIPRRSIFQPYSVEYVKESKFGTNPDQEEVDQ